MFSLAVLRALQWRFFALLVDIPAYCFAAQDRRKGWKLVVLAEVLKTLGYGFWYYCHRATKEDAFQRAWEWRLIAWTIDMAISYVVTREFWRSVGWMTGANFLKTLLNALWIARWGQ